MKNPELIHDVPHQVFMKFLKALKDKGVSEQIINNLRATVIENSTTTENALRIAISNETAEYPITLLQSHPDALITATYETASHPIAENPDWEFEGVNV